MDYYVTITHLSLRCDQDITQELAREDWFWHYSQDVDGQVWIAGSERLRWKEIPYIQDLLDLGHLGVQGTIQTIGDSGVRLKNVLTDHGLEEYWTCRDNDYPDNPVIITKADYQDITDL